MRMHTAAAAIVATTGVAQGQIIAFHSFEEADTSVIDGTFQQDGVNALSGAPAPPPFTTNPDYNPMVLNETRQLDSANGNQIDWDRTGTLTDSEMSFDAFYTFNNQNTVIGISGLAEGDFTGITSFSPVNGFGPGGFANRDDGDEIFADGNRGYEIQSTDGGFQTLVFETVNFGGPEWFFEMAVAFETTGWENAGNNIDFMDVSVFVDGGQQITVFNVFGDEIESEGLDSSTFFKVGTDLSGFTEATLQITFQANETTWIDDIRFEEGIIPAPGAMALFGLGGLAAARRRR
ncbi:MAG: PEP-CTERM sorting domain-containing protein [Planctomycetota bacterium]